tara:strand:- start:1453 stop:2298 length:846 start_codon:yes stop_codon:yes gene_type:complete
MLLTESQIKSLVRKMLEDKVPKIGKEMFDGDFYKSKDDKIKGLTMIWHKSQFAYFLLPKGSKLSGAASFKITSIPKQGEKNLNWSADLDNYKDYSQTKFFKHIKAGRIVSGTSFIKQKDSFDTSTEDFFYNFGFDAANVFIGLFELLPIPGIQQAATVLSKGISTATFLAAVRKDEYVTALFAVMGMVPAVGGAMGTSLKLLAKYKSAKILPGSVLRKCAAAMLKFLDSDIQYTVTSIVDGLLQGTDISSEMVIPKMHRAARHYAKLLNEEADNSDIQGKK